MLSFILHDPKKINYYHDNNNWVSGQMNHCLFVNNSAFLQNAPTNHNGVWGKICEKSFWICELLFLGFVASYE